MGRDSRRAGGNADCAQTYIPRMTQPTRPSASHAAPTAMAAVLGVLLAFAPCARPAFAQRRPAERQAPATYALYIGTYTRGWACAEKNDCTSGGIYRAEFDATTGALSVPELVATAVNPSYVTVHPNGRFAYAVSEVADYGGRRTGAVSAYRIGTGGQLTAISMLSSFGTDPCHLSVDASGRHLFVANYGGGSIASYRIAASGLLTMASTIRHTGSGPHPNQQAPHAHYIAESHARGRVYVADLGTDQVRVVPCESRHRRAHAERRAAGCVASGQRAAAHRIPSRESPRVREQRARVHRDRVQP